ncbi:hypothetical protein F5Y05DRAFT_45398 [Hypoxylon sp. FL0543]|nr:hypothetical protein F5Y05DRAFT_45398 [Hypoxylon sp. FL0543]
MADNINSPFSGSAPLRVPEDRPNLHSAGSWVTEPTTTTHNIPIDRIHRAAQTLGISPSDLYRRLRASIPPDPPTPQTVPYHSYPGQLDRQDDVHTKSLAAEVPWPTSIDVRELTTEDNDTETDLVAGIMLPNTSVPFRVPVEAPPNPTAPRSFLRDQWASPLPHISEDIPHEPTTETPAETLRDTPGSAAQGSARESDHTDTVRSDSGTLSTDGTNGHDSVDSCERNQYDTVVMNQACLPRRPDALQRTTSTGIALSDLSTRHQPPTSFSPSSENTIEGESQGIAQNNQQLVAITQTGPKTHERGTGHPGPSKVWEIPRRTRQRKRREKAGRSVSGVDQEPKRHDHERHNHATPRRRRAFADDAQRKMTADTRRRGACIRCRLQRNRCRPDPNNRDGPCLTCLEMSSRTISKLACLRLIITDASIYREQPAPYQGFSKRWQNMDIVDIQDWASEEVKTIYISQAFLDAPYPVKVREFIPREGDLIEEKWVTNGVEKSHWVPRYALADMEKHAEELQAFIDHNVGKYIVGAIGTEDDFLWDTYCMAFKRANNAKTHRERQVLRNLFRLWVAICKTCNIHHIYGEDKLGAELVSDPNSPWHNRVPMPALIIAQKECIIYTKIFRPLSKEILRDLQYLVVSKKREYWLTTYLTIFILMHSCAMITRRDEETARQYGLRERFANPNGIAGHHIAAQTMLAHFNYINTGFRPFQLALEPSGQQELMQGGQLNEDEVKFVRNTALWIKDNETLLHQIQRDDDYGHPYYWISQIYQESWTPGPRA